MFYKEKIRHLHLVIVRLILRIFIYLVLLLIQMIVIFCLFVYLIIQKCCKRNALAICNMYYIMPIKLVIIISSSSNDSSSKLL